jgi:glutamate N-acetyltransferase/amino-acid N-acetyltransferase
VTQGCCFATGASGIAITKDSPEHKAFQTALDSLMIELAVLIAKDGEGAQKLMTIDVRGAESDDAARRIGPCDWQFAVGENRDRG